MDTVWLLVAELGESSTSQCITQQVASTKEVSLDTNQQIIRYDRTTCVKITHGTCHIYRHHVSYTNTSTILIHISIILLVSYNSHVYEHWSDQWQRCDSKSRVAPVSIHCGKVLEDGWPVNKNKLLAHSFSNNTYIYIYTYIYITMTYHLTAKQKYITIWTTLLHKVA